jgi:hypothetical protein
VICLKVVIDRRGRQPAAFGLLRDRDQVCATMRACIHHLIADRVLDKTPGGPVTSKRRDYGGDHERKPAEHKDTAIKSEGGEYFS